MIPRFPSRLGGLIRKNVRQMLSVLDTYLAFAVSLGGTAYRFASAQPDADAYPILTFLAGLALSTYAQCLFGLDSSSGTTRYGLLPLARWQVLLAKDIAWLGVLLVVVLPLDTGYGLSFGLAALAIGHFAPLRAQQRWRFTSGRVGLGAAQVLAGGMLGAAEERWGAGLALIAAVAWIVSLYLAPKRLPIQTVRKPFRPS